MAEVDLADGFDVSEPLLWGLTTSQLGTLGAGAALAYAAIRAPLPPAAAAALAALVTAAACALALLRVEGRTLAAWAGAAARFRARPRHGFVVVQGGAGGETAGDRVVGTAAANPTSGDPGTGPGAPRRRPTLVLLPEPARGAGEDGWPDRRRPGLEVGEGAAAGAPAELRTRPGPGPGGADPQGCDGGAGAALHATRRVTFFSLAGGTGRTTLAVEVAALLASRSAAPWPAPAVALLDLDLMSPRASVRLGVPLLTGWGDAVSELPLREALNRLVRVHPSGLRVVPGPAAVPAGKADPWGMGAGLRWGRASHPEAPPEAGWAPDGPLLARLAWLVAGIERQGCHTVVLDVPAGLGPVSRWALEAAHDIVVVLTPTAGGLQDAYRSTEALRRLGLGRKVRYAVNRGSDPRLFAEAMADLGGTVVAAIPDDPALERAEAEHRLVAVQTSGATAKALRALAATADARLAVRPPAARGRRRLLGRRAV